MPQQQPTDRIAVYPSAQIRPIPGFVFSIPEGWVLDESPDALVVAHTPEAHDGFWVNAIVSHDRIARGVDLKKAAAITFERIKRQVKDVVIKQERMGKFGDRDTYLRAIQFVTADGTRQLAQIHGLSIAPTPEAGKVHDLFQIVGTCSLADVDTYGPKFVEIISSFRFT
jgi:hypothetical protein